MITHLQQADKNVEFAYKLSKILMEFYNVRYLKCICFFKVIAGYLIENEEMKKSCFTVVKLFTNKYYDNSSKNRNNYDC